MNSTDRTSAARDEILIALAYRFPNRPSGHILKMVAQALETVPFQSFVHGQEPLDVDEVIYSVSSSGYGKLVTDDVARNGQDETEVDYLTELEGKSPQQRINWARRNHARV